MGDDGPGWPSARRESVLRGASCGISARSIGWLRRGSRGRSRGARSKEGRGGPEYAEGRYSGFRD